MKYSLDHLQKLKEAYATGALEVRFGDKKVIYRSEREMAQIIATVERELGAHSREGLRFVQFSYDKGTQ